MLLQRIGKNCRLSLSASLSPARYHIPYRDSLWIEFKFLFQEGGEGGSFNEKQSTSLIFLQREEENNRKPTTEIWAASFYAYKVFLWGGENEMTPLKEKKGDRCSRPDVDYF